jgi:putative ABC transport system permease protein
VSPQYFETLGIPLRKGRMFTEADRGRLVVLLSERAAHTVSTTSEALGVRVVPGSNDPAAEVIGVVSDVRTTGLENAGSLVAYVPYWQRPPATASLVIRATGDPAASIAAARAQIRDVAPAVPITGARTMMQVVSASVAQRRFQLLLLSLFAVTALMAASIGIYGIVAQSFARRSNEVGLRLAMGASPGDIRGLVLREGLSPAAGGIVLGIAVSLASGRLLANLLFQVRPADPVVLAPVIVVLVLAALAACWMPARRAARVDPVVALRTE